jgi:hypothetical protein
MKTGKNSEINIGDIEIETVDIVNDNNDDSNDGSNDILDIDIDKVNLNKMMNFKRVGLDKVEELGEIKRVNGGFISEVDELIEISLKIALLSNNGNNRSICVSLYKESVVPRLNKILANREHSLPLNDLIKLMSDLYCVIDKSY